MRLAMCNILFLVLVTSALGGQTVEKFIPSSASVGDPIEIVGKGFGSDPGGKVTVDGKAARTTKWADESIIAVVPRGLSMGKKDVSVTLPNGTAAGMPSPAPTFTVSAPEFDASAFEVLTGVGATLAGVEATSYKVSNDALSSTNVGRKTPEILLGGGFILPWREGGGWIERRYCPTPSETSDDCRPGGAYYHYRPYEVFLSLRFAPASDQTINGFVLGGGYRITKYLSFIAGYSVTPIDEPSRGFRIAASQIVAANPTISPYNRYNANDILHADEKAGVLDGFPLFIYDANGITTQKLFPNSPTVTHYRSGIYFGVGIPLNLTALFKPSAGK